MGNIKTIIEDILLEMGVNPANKGFGCIVCAVQLLHENPTLKSDMTGLYHKTAEVLNDNKTRVERSIRYEKDSLFRYKESKNLEKYFPGIGDKFPNRRFLCALNLHVERRMNGETDAG